MITKESLVNDLKAIGLKQGNLLHIKVSMRSIGNVEGGAKTLLDAVIEVIGGNGTLISDAFIPVYPLPLSKEHSQDIADDYSPSYAGVFTNEMIKHPKMIRSKHPIQKFVAIGKRAEEFCNSHNYESGAYDVMRKLADADAINLNIGEKVIGVGTSHVAIEELGFKRKQLNLGRLYKNEIGEITIAKVNWNGGCANGFPKFIPLYHQNGAVLNTGKIGKADSLLTSMKKTLEVEIDTLKASPDFFFCNNNTCYSCQITWEHSPKKYFKFYYNWLKKNFKTLSFKRLRNIFKTVS
ncbi:MAG: AAC(3) family N-acetyltransferase [Bacteroidales bacterium]|nr:AAC(3) family N-acetyltransferase [Bacteroidales bacterium]